MLFTDKKNELTAAKAAVFCFYIYRLGFMISFTIGSTDIGYISTEPKSIL
jgi:hypothetical protein